MTRYWAVEGFEVLEKNKDRWEHIVKAMRQHFGCFDWNLREGTYGSVDCYMPINMCTYTRSACLATGCNGDREQNCYEMADNLMRKTMRETFEQEYNNVFGG